MTMRIYFIVGDLAANVLAGSLVGATVAAIVHPGWSIPVATVAAMIGGTLMAIPIAVLFFPLCGAFETMLPVMTTGMCTGMLAGMVAACGWLSVAQTAAAGGTVGIVVLAGVGMLDARLKKGKAKWTA